VHVLAHDREAARAHFGFNVPFITAPNALEIISAVRHSKGDLGFIGLENNALENNASPWWQALGGDNPMIMATYPVLATPQAVVIAPSNTDTHGLPTKIIITTAPHAAFLCRNGDEKLVQVPRDEVTEGRIIGYS
jgi:hypothetical protein